MRELTINQAIADGLLQAGDSFEYLSVRTNRWTPATLESIYSYEANAFVPGIGHTISLRRGRTIRVHSPMRVGGNIEYVTEEFDTGTPIAPRYERAPSRFSAEFQ